MQSRPDPERVRLRGCSVVGACGRVVCGKRQPVLGRGLRATRLAQQAVQRRCSAGVATLCRPYCFGWQACACSAVWAATHRHDAWGERAGEEKRSLLGQTMHERAGCSGGELSGAALRTVAALDDLLPHARFPLCVASLPYMVSYLRHMIASIPSSAHSCGCSCPQCTAKIR